MLVLFQFRRFGHYAKGLIEAENLDKAGEALWNEKVSTFNWETAKGWVPETANSLTVEEYKDEHGSDGKIESEAKS